MAAMAAALGEGFSSQDVALRDLRTPWFSQGSPLAEKFLFSPNWNIIPLDTLFKSYLKLPGLPKLLTGYKYTVFKPVKSSYSLYTA